MTHELQPIPSFQDAPWMRWALAELGQREIPGNTDNPRILLYHSYAGARAKDETPWCSAFANFCMTMAGYEGTRSKAARSWLRWGYPLTEPRKGCVVVFWRKSRVGPYGHVAFYMGEAGTDVLVLGGNQGNAVSVKPYPKRRVLAYRWINA